MKKYLILLVVPVVVFAFGSITLKKIDVIENNTGTDIILNPVNDVKINSLSGGMALQSGSLKEIEESFVTNTELGYLSGSTLNIQTQLNAKANAANLISTTTPLQGGGNISIDRTLSILQSGAAQDGYLSSVDWNTFNGKANAGSFVDLNTNQSIAGTKTFVGQIVATSVGNGSHPAPTMTEVQRDAITGMNAGDIIYNSDTNVLNIYDGSSWNELSGGGSGSGGINYILEGAVDAEADIGNWLTYNDAAGLNPVDGTGGSPVITYARNTVAPLRGIGDFKLVKGATNRQGDGSSSNFTIDIADQSKKLTISFDYDTSHANYSDDDIRFSIYDVTNSVLIRINGEDLKGGKGKHYAQFQTASNSLSYRLIAHISSTNATAYDVYFDNFIVGPTELSNGTIAIDTKFFIPVWDNSSVAPSIGNGVLSGHYRRVGEKAEITYFLEFGTTTTTGTGSSWTFGLPNGLIVDQSKLSSPVTSPDYARTVGFGQTGNSAAAGKAFSVRYDPDLTAQSSSSISEGFFLPPTDATGNIGPSSPFAWGSTDSLSFTVVVPILGWSSNTTMSSDLSGRDIVFEVEGSNSQVFSTTSYGYDKLTFTGGVVTDTVSSWDSVNNWYVIPETGYYDITASYARVFGSSPSLVNIDMGLKLDARDKQLSTQYTNTIDTSYVSSGSITNLYIEKGTQVYVYARKQGIETSTQSGDSRQNYLNISKRSSPQAILETSTVAARYTSNSGQVVSNTITTIKYEDVSNDTHNAYNVITGEYIVPESGWYDVSAKYETASTVWTTHGAPSLYIKVDGVLIDQSYFRLILASTANIQVSISTDIYLEKDSVLIISGDCSTITSMTTGSIRNTFSIHRIK